MRSRSRVLGAQLSDGKQDNTHLQETGARTIAQMILADLYRQGLAPGTLAKTVPHAP